jgi:PIN domain nuclease of toxin-antitoxin system
VDGLLLDTHVMLWALLNEPIRQEARDLMRLAQPSRSLFVSHISAWEVGVAYTKPQESKRPNLLGMPPNLWFQRAVRDLSAKALPISYKVALEASLVPAVYGSGDPGDCFLIATARLHNLMIITRDAHMIELARQDPKYLRVLPA